MRQKIRHSQYYGYHVLSIQWNMFTIDQLGPRVYHSIFTLKKNRIELVLHVHQRFTNAFASHVHINSLSESF